MNILAALKIQESLANSNFINIHLYWTDKNCENSIAMQNFNKNIASMPDSSLRKTIEEMLKGINRGRPKFSEVHNRV